MIELVEGAIYKSTSGRVKYTGIDRFHGEQTLRFKRLERVGTDYIFLDKIEEFICVEGEEKTYDELVAMNKELLAALEAASGLLNHFGDAYGCEPSNYIEYKMAATAITKAKGTA